MRKMFWLIVLLVMVGFPAYFIFADPINATGVLSPHPGYGQTGNNIGAYYDEYWVATRYLYTNAQGNDRVVFASGGTLPSGSGVAKVEPADDGSGGIVPGATLANEVIVIKWQSSGHIHFVAGGGL